MSERDYLKDVDLNTPPTPVNNSLDPRAMHYFGFLSNGQDIQLLQPVTGANVRVLVSWRYGNSPGPFSPAFPPQADAVLDFFSGPTGQVLRYETNHDRAHALIWLDPATPPPTGPVMVRVRAWKKD